MNNLSTNGRILSLSKIQQSGKAINDLMIKCLTFEEKNPNHPALNDRKIKLKQISEGILEALELEQELRLTYERLNDLRNEYFKQKSELMSLQAEHKKLTQIDSL
jgi:phosphoglycerate-specific signal transduction histidine kinase